MGQQIQRCLQKVKTHKSRTASRLWCTYQARPHTKQGAGEAQVAGCRGCLSLCSGRGACTCLESHNGWGSCEKKYNTRIQWGDMRGVPEIRMRTSPRHKCTPRQGMQASWVRRSSQRVSKEYCRSQNIINDMREQSARNLLCTNSKHNQIV